MACGGFILLPDPVFQITGLGTRRKNGLTLSSYYYCGTTAERDSSQWMGKPLTPSIPSRPVSACQGCDETGTPLQYASADHTTIVPRDYLTDDNQPVLRLGRTFYTHWNAPSTPRLWPLLFPHKRCHQGQMDTSSRGGHQKKALQEGKHSLPHYSRACGMQQLLAAKCRHVQRLSRPPGTSIKASPVLLSLTHFS